MRKKLCTTAAGALTASLACALFWADPALAAGDGHGLPWGDFAWRVVNLVVFVAILWHFAGKLAVNYFRGRKQGIKDGIDDLTAKRAEARDRLAEIEDRIANLEAEREAILAESRAQAEALKEEIIAKAKEQADQIVAMARVAAESEGQNLLQQMRATIADELVDATRDKLVKSLNKAKHEKLIDNSLKKVVLQ